MNYKEKFIQQIEKSETWYELIGFLAGFLLRYIANLCFLASGLMLVWNLVLTVLTPVAPIAFWQALLIGYAFAFIIQGIRNNG